MLLVILPGVLGAGAAASSRRTDTDVELERAIRAADAPAIIARMQSLSDEDPQRAVRVLPSAFARVEELTAAFAKDERYRVFLGALAALSHLPDRDAVRALGAAFGTEPAWAARWLILHAAVKDSRLDAVSLALRGLEDPAGRVVIAAARVLGASEKARVIAPLVEAMKRWENRDLRARVAEGRPRVASPDDGARAWLACRDALNRLTGKSFHSAFDYENYVSAFEGQMDPAALKGAGDAAPLGGERTGVGLFGLEVTGREIVFILDISGSMEATDPPPPEELERLRGRTSVAGSPDPLLKEIMNNRRRIVRARKELVKVVEGLSEDRKFNIVAFSTEVTPWEPSLRPATEGKKREAVQFIRGLTATGVTFTDEALRRAFLDPHVDTVYLITDGAPTHVGSGGSGGHALPADAPELMQRILEETRVANHLRDVRLFTLGFEGAREEWLKQLAAENQGRYRRIR